VKGALTARTWYEDTAIAPLPTTLSDDISGEYDAAIIGGGLAGLSLLERLAKAGWRVILLERATVGAGASGRNGGFCSPGWAADIPQIRRLVGPRKSDILAKISNEGVAWMKARATLPGWEASAPVDGVLTVSLAGRADAATKADENFLDEAALAAMMTTRRYRWGVLAPTAFHFHPLNFMRLLARAALEAGSQILEETPLLSARHEKRLYRLTLGGTSREVHARKLIYATGGYGGDENRYLARRLLPIRTYIGVSEPMPELLDRHIGTDWAIGDTRRAGNYYRRLPDGRLLWGMGITAFGTLDQKAVKAMVARDIKAVYPKLARDMLGTHKGLSHAWAGNMAYARHFMPYVGEIRPDIYALIGFGGQGMNTAPATAMALADHLTGQNPDALAPFADIPMRRSFGTLGRSAAEGIYRARRALDWGAERFR